MRVDSANVQSRGRNLKGIRQTNKQWHQLQCITLSLFLVSIVKKSYS